jgi:hypothetical protein
MFRPLLAHPQEVFHTRLLVYYVRVMSVGCSRIGVALIDRYTMTRGQQNMKLIDRFFGILDVVGEYFACRKSNIFLFIKLINIKYLNLMFHAR